MGMVRGSSPKKGEGLQETRKLLEGELLGRQCDLYQGGGACGCRSRAFVLKSRELRRGSSQSSPGLWFNRAGFKLKVTTESTEASVVQVRVLICSPLFLNLLVLY